MPDKPPPVYRWAVSLYDGRSSTVEAAYPVLEGGDMLLKDQAHKIVFAAERGTGCTFTRGALADAAPGPVSVTGGFPANCACTYTATWNSGVMSGRWLRNINWACEADHAEVDRLAVVAADSDVADNPPPGTGYWPCGCPVEPDGAERAGEGTRL